MTEDREREERVQVLQARVNQLEHALRHIQRNWAASDEIARKTIASLAAPLPAPPTESFTEMAMRCGDNGLKWAAELQKALEREGHHVSRLQLYPWLCNAVEWSYALRTKALRDAAEAEVKS